MPVENAPYLKNRVPKTLAPTLLQYQLERVYDWEPNTPFDATLEILNTAGSKATVQDINTKTRYWILNSYLLELIKKDVIHQAKITGTWKVYKQGQSFGVRLI